MITTKQIIEAKGKGFLQNRGTEMFSGRIVARGTVFSSQNFADIATLADKYGNGKVFATSRLSVEIPGIQYNDIDNAIAFAKQHNLYFGGTGNKIRPITACKGTTCIYGNCDTQAIAQKIHDNYYVNWNNVKLPHKFKIGVGGCPNSCMKPSLNDFGIEGRKIPDFNSAMCKGCSKCIVEQKCPSKAAKVENGKLSIANDKCIACGVCVGKCPFNAVSPSSKTVYKIFVGGTWGKTTRMGTPLTKMISEEEMYDVLEKSILWFKENAKDKERFGVTIDRVGFKKFENDIKTDDLLQRKQKVLSK